MMVFLACRRGLSSRAVAEEAWGSGDAHVQSTAMRRPRLQAFGARGAPNLTVGFAAKPSPSAPWARGLLSVFWERGSPDFPACGPPRGQAAGRTTHLHQQSDQDLREGPSLARRTTQDLLWSGLARQAHEERRYQGGANLTKLS